MEFLLCWSTTPGPGACPGMWLTCRGMLHCRKFPFPSRHHGKWFLGWGGTLCQPPLLCLIRSCAGLVCAVMVSVCSYVHQGCCVWRRCFFVFISRLWLLPFFSAFSSTQIPKPWEDRFHENISFRTDWSEVSHSSMLSSCGSLCWLSCTATEASPESSGTLVWVSPSQLPFFPYRQERLSLGPYCAAHALSHWELWRKACWLLFGYYSMSCKYTILLPWITLSSNIYCCDFS